MKALPVSNPQAFVRLCCAFSFTVSGQSEDPRAEELLGKVSVANAAVRVGSRSSTPPQMVDVQSDFQMDQNGEVWIEGDRYHLELGDYVIVCDGSTVWTYEPEMGECYIDDAETIAEDGVDPARMFTIWEERASRKCGRASLEIGGEEAGAGWTLHPTGSRGAQFSHDSVLHRRHRYCRWSTWS